MVSNMEQELLFLFPSRNLGMRLRKIIAIGNTKGGKCSFSDEIKIALRLDLLHDIVRT